LLKFFLASNICLLILLLVSVCELVSSDKEMCCFYLVQCIQRLKAEHRQLQEQVECLEEKLDQCQTRNTDLTTELCTLKNVKEQLQAKTAECDKLAACNVRHLCKLIM